MTAVNTLYTRKHGSTHTVGLSSHFSQKYLDSFWSLSFVHAQHGFVGFAFFLLVVIWKDNENKQEPDVPEGSCGPTSAAAKRFLYHSFLY